MYNDSACTRHGKFLLIHGIQRQQDCQIPKSKYQMKVALRAAIDRLLVSGPGLFERRFLFAGAAFFAGMARARITICLQRHDL